MNNNNQTTTQTIEVLPEASRMTKRGMLEICPKCHLDYAKLPLHLKRRHPVVVS